MSFRSLGFVGDPRGKCRVPPCPPPPRPRVSVARPSPASARPWESALRSGPLPAAAPGSPHAVRPSCLWAVTVTHVHLAFGDLGSLGARRSDSRRGAPLSGFVSLLDHGSTGVGGLGGGDYWSRVPLSLRHLKGAHRRRDLSGTGLGHLAEVLFSRSLPLRVLAGGPCARPTPQGQRLPCAPLQRDWQV